MNFSENDKEIFMKAMEEYFTKGKSETKCNVCNSIIVFERLNSDAIKHLCKCGKFNGSLKK